MIMYVGMYVTVYLRTCIYIYACMQVCEYACMYVSASIHVSGVCVCTVCLDRYLYICTYVCLYVCMHACMHDCLDAIKCACTLGHTHAYMSVLLFQGPYISISLCCALVAFFLLTFCISLYVRMYCAVGLRFRVTDDGT